MNPELTSGNLALYGGERRVIKIEANEERNAKKLRVAAYCRVSSSSEDQLNSFMAQNTYYTQYITANEHWRLVDIYADDGISGTTFNRPGFQEMIADIEAGIVKRVIIKDYCAIIGLNQKDLENQGILA